MKVIAGKTTTRQIRTNKYPRIALSEKYPALTKSRRSLARSGPSMPNFFSSIFPAKESRKEFGTASGKPPVCDVDAEMGRRRCIDAWSVRWRPTTKTMIATKPNAITATSNGVISSIRNHSHFEVDHTINNDIAHNEQS